MWVGAKQGRGGSTPNELVLTFGVITSVPILVKNDDKTRHTRTLYNLSHAICYSYGADINE